jgi:hypothetical protein
MSGSGRVERFEKPDKTCVGLQDANYSRIGADGMPTVGTWFEPEEIVIGRTYRDSRATGTAAGPEDTWPTMGGAAAAAAAAASSSAAAGAKHDNSICVRDERGVVQSVGSVTTDSGLFHIKEVVLRTQCLNEIGDKYFCRHGQKGTTGLNRKTSDMMFSAVTGRPAVVHMSPIGILARMTDGHMLEMHKSTAAALLGQFVNATSFLSKSQLAKEVDVAAALMSVGAQRLGYERFINGMTGELTQPLLTGLIYMSPLVHLVGSKIHARNRGPRKLLTRQPDDGRSKHGGLRFGQMEVDAFAALGAARFLVERLKTTSDEYMMPVCSKCGLIAEVSRESGYGFCRTCFTGKDVGVVSVSYSQKLFYQELYALHIKPQLILADETPDAADASTQPPGGAPVSDMVDDDNAEDMLADNNNAEEGAPPEEDEASYYGMAQVPEPEPWEWESLGMAAPINLRRKLQEMAAAAPATTPSSGPSSSSLSRTLVAAGTPSSMDLGPSALMLAAGTPSPAALPMSARAAAPPSPLTLPPPPPPKSDGARRKRAAPDAATKPPKKRALFRPS